MINLKATYQKNRLWVILASFLLLLLLIFLIPFLLWPPLFEVFKNPENLKTFVSSFEEWAIAIYVLLSIIVIIAPPIPNDIVPIVGGIVFGFWQALLWGIFARIIGSTINYWLGTKIRNGLFLKVINEEEKTKLSKYTDRIGWQFVFISRFLPSTVTDLIAYASGIAKMDYPKFILASFLGMLVPVSASILIGASLFTNKYLFFTLIAFYMLGILFAPKIIKKLALHKST